MIFYDEEQKHAYPWEMAWPKMNYFIASSEYVFKLRRDIANRIPYLKKLTDKELKPQFDKYILPIPGHDNNPIDMYDPLSGFIEVPPPKDPPYIELARLDLTDEQAITNFACQNGLLGILFHNYKYIPFTGPYISEIENDQQSDKANKATQSKTEEEIDAYLENVSFRFRKGGIQSKDKRTVDIEPCFDDGLWFSYEEDGVSLIPMFIKQINDYFFPLCGDPYEPVNIITNPDGWKLLEHIAGQKESIPNDYWLYIYAEPLELFRKEAGLFIDTYRKAAEFDKAQKEKHKIDRDIASLFGDFNKNLKHIHPRPKFIKDEGLLGYSWEVPSLLSAYYLMLYLDITNNRVARFCAYRKCNRPFIAVRNHNIFCSPRCQDNTKKDRKRHPELYK